jgi:hypothetical protein
MTIEMGPLLVPPLAWFRSLLLFILNHLDRDRLPPDPVPLDCLPCCPLVTYIVRRTYVNFFFRTPTMIRSYATLPPSVAYISRLSEASAHCPGNLDHINQIIKSISHSVFVC